MSKRELCENHRKRLTTLRTVVEDESDVRHFSPIELIRLRSEWPLPQIFPPPEDLMANILPTLEIADQIREEWGGPVVVLSGYRPPAYNDEIVNGSERSQHLQFRALDLAPANEFSYQTWERYVSEIVQDRRDSGQIIGFGRYSESRFVHVDTGRYNRNRDWYETNL